jgi:hypothetical protein
LSEEADLFDLDPDKGAFVASFGPKGTGKSELITRLFARFPYNGLLIDYARDVDPQYRFTEPIPPAVHALANELGAMGDVDPSSLGSFIDRLRVAWRGDPSKRFRKYRYVPNFVAKDWLERTDNYIGLAYLLERCAVELDEINEEAPVGSTPRWTRAMLRVGRHQRCSMLMAGPRPTDLDPMVLNQADVVTVHGQLHELDIRRMAKQLHLKDAELMSLIQNLARYERGDSPLEGVGDFLAYFKRGGDLAIYPPLPPRPKSMRARPPDRAPTV